MSNQQEASFLQWASITLDSQVSSLKSIQDVRFVKNLLWHVEESYFTNWKNGNGNESYAQVLQIILKYFRDVIGIDITQTIEGINVYKNVIQVWQLVLCVAIKGRKRGTNINIIFEMDESLQSVMADILRDIIDKYGQNAATDITQKKQNQDAEEKNLQGKQRKMMIEFAEQNEQLKQRIRQLQLQLKKQIKNASAQRAELQHSLQMMRLQKMAFFQIMANANASSSSKIFEEEEDVLVSSQVSLSQLAKDIIGFIRNEQKLLTQERQKSSALEEELNNSQNYIRRCVEQNQTYLMQLGNLSVCQKELQVLRIQKNQVMQQNLLLMQQISNLEEEKYQIVDNFQKRMQNMEGDSDSESNSQMYNTRNKMSRRQTKINRNNGKSQFSEDSNQITIRINDAPLDAQITQRGTSLGKQMDQAREPQLRNKMQREIIYLKTTINGLKRQNESLKKANQTLQRATSQFMDSNQKVVKKWQEDYQSLLDKMSQLVKLKDQEKEKLTDSLNVKQVPQSNAVGKESQQSLEQSKRSKGESKSSKGDSQKIQKDRLGLWEEIVNKLKQIVKAAKAKELSYENSINSLRHQNLKLLQIIKSRSKQQDLQSSRVEQYDSSKQGKMSQLQKSKSSQQRELLAQRQKEMLLARPVNKIAFLSNLEADDNEQLGLSKRIDKSIFFKVDSMILHGIQQKKSQLNSNDEHYLNLNRRLSYSIKQSLQGLGRRASEPDIVGSVDLKQKLQKQISKIQSQYQQLNENYQSVFNKLNIYTQQLKQKESFKKEYVQILAQLTKAEEEVKIGHQSEIVRLRLINDNLHRSIVQSAVEKQEILLVLNRVVNDIKLGLANRQTNYQYIFQQVQQVLKQAQIKYSHQLKDPLNFLQVCLNGNKQEGNLEKFYRLYMKQRQKTARLNEELQLLSCALLQYRSMCS